MVQVNAAFASQFSQGAVAHGKLWNGGGGGGGGGLSSIFYPTSSKKPAASTGGYGQVTNPNLSSNPDPAVTAT